MKRKQHQNQKARGQTMRKFSAHDAIVVTNPITVECCNNDVVAKGERGTIVDVDPETNDVCVRLSSHHPELKPLRNIVYLPAVSAKKHLQHPSKPPKSFDFVHIGLCLATVAILVMVAEPRHDPASAGQHLTAVSCELPIAATRIENLHLSPVKDELQLDTSR